MIAKRKVRWSNMSDCVTGRDEAKCLFIIIVLKGGEKDKDQSEVYYYELRRLYFSLPGDTLFPLQTQPN